MYIVTLTIFFAIFLTWRESIGVMKNGMFYGFLLVTFLGVIHYDYGNDYMDYYELYKSINGTPFNWHAIMAGDMFREPGWVLLCYAFQYIGGFFVMVGVLNILQNYIYYKTIRKYVPKKWWFFSTFIYLCIINLYVMNFSMMRQGFTIAIFLWMWPWIRDGKILYSLPLLCAMSLVHSSFIFLLPFLFIGFMRISNKTIKIISVILFFLYITLWTFDDWVENAMAPFSSVEELQNYANTYGKGKSGFQMSLGALVKLTPFGVLLHYCISNKENSNEKLQFALLAMISVVIQPFTQVISMAGRIGTYFTAYSIVALPYAFFSIKEKKYRLSLLYVYVLFTLYDFKIFFDDPGWSEYFTEFHTIFSVLGNE